MYWQAWHGLVAITILGGCALANPVAYWNVHGNASLAINRLMGRDTVEFDPTDLSFITRMAAIGDSYSAGIGAGDPLGTDEVVADVINDQVPKISGNQQVILLSAGGNDAELTKILNHCVYQFFSINLGWVGKATEIVEASSDFEWPIDWQAVSRTCEEQLTRTKEIIAADTFSAKLDNVISAAKSKLASDGIIYYTGYAKFWGEDLSSDCDSVTWSIWKYKLFDFFRSTVYLSKDHRSIMNDLVDAVNSQISAAVERSGDNVKFVDYDSYVGHFGGRFCETGIDESPSESNTRKGLMFYELKTTDWAGNNPWKRSYNPIFEGTFEGDVNILADALLVVDPDATLKQEALVNSMSTMSVDVLSAELASTDAIQARSILPDGFGRVFHPQILLHQLIASLVIYEMTSINEIDNGYPAIPETFEFDSCPFIPGGSSSGNGQQIALASYINPLADSTAWDRMIDYPSDLVSVLVANVLNGPDTTINGDWSKVIDRAYASGKRILGYVRTGYLGQSQQKFETRLGSTDLADWVSQIQTDVDLWYSLYPGKIGGIFFDEGWNDCGPDNQYAELYRFISDNTKRRHPNAFTVLNPGATMPQCFEDSADTLMTFEQGYDTYMNSYVPNPGWTPKDPRKLWHIIYGVPKEDAGKVAKLALERGAGLVHITPDILPNPYDTLPDETYMQAIMDSMEGGGPKVASPSSFSANGQTSFPLGGITVTDSDYSSVSLKWDISNRTPPYAYSVFRDGKEVARIPGTMDHVTIGNIAPGSSMSFTVRAIGQNGVMTADSRTVSASTKILAGNQAVTNAKVTATASSTNISADFLVPFAFMRVYLTDPDTNCKMPSWPINFNSGNYICTHYMVENEILYEYSGSELASGETNYHWAWTSIGSAPATRDGYTWTWELPVGTNTRDSTFFSVQAQGYGPLTNVFHPCPSKWDDGTAISGAYCTGEAPYDCKGETLCSTTNVKWCDKAVNQMNRGETVYTANSEALALEGNCWSNNAGFGCSVRIRGTDENGKNCKITGDEMWHAYQDIRNFGGCEKCGTKHFGNGCMVSVDYYYGCDNRDAGVLSLDLGENFVFNSTNIVS
ncbi:fibronectin type III domain protein [Aspergillus ambiguus]|uniref:fibronectin type III domain protein n=1 Tax=Aspergillus ambiguus TaxID=176160 RepID=UPI003CCD67EB